MAAPRPSDLAEAAGQYGTDVYTGEPSPAPEPGELLNTFRPTQASLAVAPAWRDPGEAESDSFQIGDNQFIPNLNYEPGGGLVWERMRNLLATDKRRNPQLWALRAAQTEDAIDLRNRMQAELGAVAMTEDDRQ